MTPDLHQRPGHCCVLLVLFLQLLNLKLSRFQQLSHIGQMFVVQNQASIMLHYLIFKQDSQLFQQHVFDEQDFLILLLLHLMNRVQIAKEHFMAITLILQYVDFLGMRTINSWDARSYVSHYLLLLQLRQQSHYSIGFQNFCPQISFSWTTSDPIHYLRQMNHHTIGDHTSI